MGVATSGQGSGVIEIWFSLVSESEQPCILIGGSKNVIKRIIGASLLALVMAATSTHAGSERLTDQELAKLPEDTKRFVLFKRKIEGSKGFKGIKTMSFSESNMGALTGFVRDNGEQKVFQVRVDTDSDHKPSLTFLSHDPCAHPGRLLRNETVRIDGQNLKAKGLCAPDRRGNNMMVYLLESEAGLNFAANAFRNSRYVFAEIEGIEVPFDTDGFSEAWMDAAQPAL